MIICVFLDSRLYLQKKTFIGLVPDFLASLFGVSIIGSNDAFVGFGEDHKEISGSRIFIYATVGPS